MVYNNQHSLIFNDHLFQGALYIATIFFVILFSTIIFTRYKRFIKNFFFFHYQISQFYGLLYTWTIYYYANLTNILVHVLICC